MEKKSTFLQTRHC